MITDNFNRADGAPGANWSAFRTNQFAIASLEAAPGGSNESRGSLYTGTTWNADQASSAIIRGTITGATYISLVVRGSGSGASRSCYQFSFNQNVYYITKVVNGSGTDVVGPVSRTQATGARLSVSVETSGANAIIRVWSGDPYTGTQINSYTDTSSVIASGSPGLEFYTDGTAIRADDWNGYGEVSASTVPPTILTPNQFGFSAGFGR